MKSPNENSLNLNSNNKPHLEQCIIHKTPQKIYNSPKLERRLLVRFSPQKSERRCFNTSLQTINESDISDDKTKSGSTPLSRNPFDITAEALCLPSCSPSFFSTSSENKKNEGTFRWSIEQLSNLFPADIDESSQQEIWMDPEQEEKAQKAIDKFFSQKKIVPSPWLSSSSSLPKSEGSCRRRFLPRSYFNTCTDASTQTTLTFPPDLNLMMLLEKYFTYQEDDDSVQITSCSGSEILNASSLRRKLFANDEKDEYESPCRSSYSKITSFSRRSIYDIEMSTPSSDVHSSSPITPRNCSVGNAISPPPPRVSPIAIPLNDSFSPGKPETLFPEESEDKSMRSVMNDSYPDLTSQSMNISQEYQGPSYVSDKQDTGYATGSMNSASDFNGISQSRIAEVVGDFFSQHTLDFQSNFNDNCSMYDISMSTTSSKPLKYSINSSWVPNGFSTPTKSSKK